MVNALFFQSFDYNSLYRKELCLKALEKYFTLGLVIALSEASHRLVITDFSLSFIIFAFEVFSAEFLVDVV